MIAVEHMAGRRAAVFGLGGSGLVTAHALAAGGAEIVCYDDKRERVEAAWDAGLPTGDLRVADFSAFDALVLSPGVPLTHPTPHWTVERAHAADVEIIGDIELFERERRARLPNTRVVAITGTNGKSTVTALTGHLLREMGAEAQVGGNIGRPVLDLDPHAGIVVLEVSSFQIDLSPTLTPDVGVLLNITSDHLDRHGTFENYRAIKERLTDAARVRVLGLDCDLVRDYATRLDDEGGSPIGFAVPTKTMATRSAGSGVVIFPSDGDARHIFVACAETLVPLGHLPQTPTLRGVHNARNAAAALAIILALGFDPADAIAHLESFPGLPHRMEEVGRDGDVVFVNDSKATNLDSAITALKALRDVYWIAGGRPKPGGVDALEPAHYDIRAAYLIGEAADEFKATLNGKLATRRCGTLDAALHAAAADARAAGGGTVLLSPACASFDQFRSFEVRGDAFRELVRAHLAKGAA